MTVENALIFLTLIWTVIFLLFGVVMVIILISVKKTLDKINNILSDAEDFTHGVSVTGKAAASTLMGLLGRARRSQEPKKLSRK
jgi:uncharacterized protein YoxC